jgi:hypothetical protein
MEHAPDDAACLRQACALRRRIAKVSHNAPLQSLYLTLVDFLETAIPEILAGGFQRDDDLRRFRAVVGDITEGEPRSPATQASAHPPLAAA